MELLRFVAVRPAQRDLPTFTLRLAFESSPFIVALLGARASETPRTAMITVARDFQASSAFISAPEQLGLAAGLARLADSLAGQDALSLEELDRRVSDAFGADAAGVRGLPTFHADRRALSDSIIALMIVPASDPLLLGALSQEIRLLDLIDRIARREEALAITGAVQAVLAEALIVPPSLFPLPPAPARTVPPSSDTEAETRERQLAELQAREELVEDTLRELLSLSTLDLRDPVPPPPRPLPPPVSRPARTPVAELLDRLILGSGRGRATAGRGDIGQAALEPARLLLRPEAMERIAFPGRELLAALRADLSHIPVTAAVDRLQRELERVGVQRARLAPPPPRSQLVHVGSVLAPARPALPALPDDLATDAGPGTVGTVRPAGVGSLLLVREQIVRYEPGEVAHIENVLRGESKERATRRFRRIEESFTIERETTSEEERDLQTTERFELQDEVSKIVQSDQAFNVGVSVSAGYGPFFQVNANTGFSSATSTTDMARRAFTYAKEVSERAVARLAERIRREQTTRTIEEFEETNRHGLDNTGAAEHIVGVYQWVDKVYQAQIYDYGMRQFFDFIAPEPAALLLRALQAPEGDDIEEPEPFTLRPDQLTTTNYYTYVQRYHVDGVEPPPPTYQTVSRAWSEKAESFTSSMTKAEMVDLPAGYEAIQAFVVATFGEWLSFENGDPIPEPPFLAVQVGQRRWSRNNGEPHRTSFALDAEQLSIPVSMLVSFPAFYAVNVEILCQRTTRRLTEWQLATHAAITQASLKLQAEYEERVAAAAVQAGVQIEGRSPLENRLIERAEIKKQCISLLVGQSFDAFGSIIESAGVFPHIDFDQAEQEGRNIRFFEQAFEWENMTYVFYPYYWGRKSRWIERLLLRDVDPIHAEFLKAGAARVVVPVRPGFDDAIAHFLETGQLWAGGDLPQIGSPLYVDILEEIRARQQAPGEELPVGEPWEVRLPTTLVRLRPDGSLPTWEQGPDGTWLPVEPS